METMSMGRNRKLAAITWAMSFLVVASIIPGLAYAASGGEPGAHLALSGEFEYGESDELDEESDGFSNGTYRFDGGDITITKVTSGDASFDALTRTLTLRNIVSNGELEVKKNLDITVVLAGDNSVPEITIGSFPESLSGHATMRGSGSLKGNITSYQDFMLSDATVYGGLYCFESVTMFSGRLNGTVDIGTSFSMQGGAISGKVEFGMQPGGTMNMSAGSIEGELDCDTLTMTGGTISSSNHGMSAVFCDTLTMTGGSIIAKGGMFGVVVNGEGMTIAGGKITCTSQTEAGIWVGGGDFVMTGGEVAVTKCEGPAIEAQELDPDSGDVYFGKVKVSGGSLTLKSKAGRLIIANSMSNDPKCLKAVKGLLPTGASFISGGNQYKVGKDMGDDVGNASLERFVATSKNYTFPKKISFGGEKYYLSGIGQKAFSTSAGSKLKSLKFQGVFPVEIAKNAFAGTKSLTKLTINKISVTEKRAKNGRLKSVKWNSPSEIAKTAFSKCGKSGGKKLTVLFAGKNLNKAGAKLYKKLLTSKGLSKSAKVK